jgi:P27 family predicted phage terminase small subunit
VLEDARPPYWLTSSQKAVWKRALAAAPPGILRTIDGQLLAEYAALVDRFRRAELLQRKLDRTVPLAMLDGEGRISPYLKIANQTLQLLLRVQSELGFSPVSRARLGQPKGAADDVEDGWSDLKRIPVRANGKAKAA